MALKHSSATSTATTPTLATLRAAASPSSSGRSTPNNSKGGSLKYVSSELSIPDSASGVNINASWVNSRGSWLVHIVLIVFAKIVFSSIPFVSSEVSWTLTTLVYNIGQFIMFHTLTGTPFEVDQGEYADLNLWEQIDGGSEFTPTKKFLTATPIVLFLISTHYSHYDIVTFTISLSSLIVLMIAKLPTMHKVRVVKNI
ncbi:Orm1 type endoplasmic reticulum protein [Ramicandelaber brevisporus]|nr:Orm1 type endoplasmic reticulum protein [Ramicandelaber brevisporus]